MTKQKSKDWSMPIAVAVIGLVGTCITAFFAIPGFQNWVGLLFAPSNPKSLAIEQIPQQQVFAYADTNAGAWGAFWLVHDNIDIPIYRLDYWLPSDKSAFAGLAFQFPDGTNLSSYGAVECKIIFTQSPDQVDMYFKDIADNYNTIRIANNGANEMVVRYEFTNFPAINFNAVKEFGLVVATVFFTGGHQVRITNVRFVK